MSFLTKVKWLRNLEPFPLVSYLHWQIQIREVKGLESLKRGMKRLLHFKMVS